MFDYLAYLPSEIRGLNWRLHPLEGKLLLFDRDSGFNGLLEGEETAHFQRIAPCTVLIAITNACNLTCHFCYRDLKSPNHWRTESLLEFCRALDEWGVLEIAFGGGEPMLFPDWANFIRELYTSTRLCINFTTNGMLLTDDFLQRIAGCYGNIRVSLYEDNHWEQTIRLLVANRARFGVNWLITPDELPHLEAKFIRLLMLGVRDFLLLSYKGSDASLHFQSDHYRQLTKFLNTVHPQMGQSIQLKLDVCWGKMLPDVPRLFVEEDCGAGDGFLSITSDKQIKICSFHHATIPFDTIDELKNFWHRQRLVRQAARMGGCGRLPERGLTIDGSVNHEIISLAAV